jgi:oligoribonuclease
MPSQSASNLVWLDLEMTGLDVAEHAILQAAVVITDDKLNVLDELCLEVWQPERVLDKMGPFVVDMHQKTGLLTKVRASKLETRDAEQKLLALVAKWCTHPATLCGNSIWQDRRFVERYMPGLAGYLHYRMIDVSSLKVLVARWYGEEALFKKPTEAEHDALFDVKNSIAELLHYRKTLFVK